MINIVINFAKLPPSHMEKMHSILEAKVGIRKKTEETKSQEVPLLALRKISN